MKTDIASDDPPEQDEIGPIGRIFLVGVRVIALPFFLFVIVVSSLFYGIAILSRFAVSIPFRLAGMMRGLPGTLKETLPEPSSPNKPPASMIR
jgi:hypothetical protein